MQAETVRGVGQFREALARAVTADGPVLLDVDMTVLRPMTGIGGPQPRA